MPVARGGINTSPRSGGGMGGGGGGRGEEEEEEGGFRGFDVVDHQSSSTTPNPKRVGAGRRTAAASNFRGVLPNQPTPPSAAILRKYASKGRETARASQQEYLSGLYNDNDGNASASSASDDGYDEDHHGWDPRNMTEEQAVRWSTT